MTLAEQRMAICNGCEHLGPIIKVCKLCGCFMPAKTLLPFAECPVGKWGKLEKKEPAGEN
jgi:hypothetical protein